MIVRQNTRFQNTSFEQAQSHTHTTYLCYAWTSQVTFSKSYASYCGTSHGALL